MSWLENWAVPVGLRYRRRSAGTPSRRLRFAQVAREWDQRLEVLAGDASPEVSDRIRPMLACAAERPPDEPGWLHEIKHDGYRGILVVDRAVGRRALFSREGRNLGGEFQLVLQAGVGLAERLGASIVLDGEIAVPDDEGRTHIASLERHRKWNPHRVRFYVFDALWVGNTDLRGRGLIERKSVVADVVRRETAGRFVYVDYVEGRGGAALEAAADAGLEGIVSKRAGAAYVGGRSRAWLKSKCYEVRAFRVMGFTGRRRLSGLLLAETEERALRYVGSVRHGLAVANEVGALEALWSLALPVQAEPGVTAVQPALVAEVKFFGRTGGGLLRHPVLKSIRVG